VIVGSRTQVTVLEPPFAEPVASVAIGLTLAREEDQA